MLTLFNVKEIIYVVFTFLKKKKKRCFHTYQLYQPNLIVKVLYLINIAPTRKENEVPTLPP